MAREQRKIIGLYSGSAADAVDAAVVGVRGRAERMHVEVLGSARHPLDGDLAEALWRLASPSQANPAGLASADLLMDVDLRLADVFAEAVDTLSSETGTAREEVEAIGSAGQLSPIFVGRGDRRGRWRSVGSPARLAQRTGRPVVGGFIESDLAAGGCGAGALAWADWKLLHDSRLSRVHVHLGGIASLTFIPAAASPVDVISYDVGPGTLFSDAVARRLFDRPFDADGALAAEGRSDPRLVHELLSGKYFRLDPPKAAAEEDWWSVHLERLTVMARKHRCGGADLAATVTELPARSVAEAVLLLTERPHQVVLSGGGARNITLARRLREILSPSSTVTSEKFGVPAAAHQAVACAVLAAARLDGVQAHCYPATGARRAVTLGAIHVP